MEQNNIILYIVITISITVLIVTFLILQYRKIKKMLDVDKVLEIYDKKGNLVQKGRSRNRWDLSYIPAFTRVFYKADWTIILAFFLLVLLAILYGIFRENSILDLLKISFGAIIGTLIHREKNKD